MVRKCASFAFGVALIVALGFAMAQEHAVKIPGDSTGFSTPCEPASPAFNAASESRAISTIDSTYAAEKNADGPGGVVGRYRVEADARATERAAPRAFPPLFRRPPPANS